MNAEAIIPPPPERLRELMGSMFGLEQSRLGDTAILREELGLDSIDLIDLLSAVGAEPGCPELHPEDFLDCRTVGDLLERYSGILAAPRAA